MIQIYETNRRILTSEEINIYSDAGDAWEWSTYYSLQKELEKRKIFIEDIIYDKKRDEYYIEETNIRDATENEKFMIKCMEVHEYCRDVGCEKCALSGICFGTAVSHLGNAITHIKYIMCVNYFKNKEIIEDEK